MTLSYVDKNKTNCVNPLSVLASENITFYCERILMSYLTYLKGNLFFPINNDSDMEKHR